MYTLLPTVPTSYLVWTWVNIPSTMPPPNRLGSTCQFHSGDLTIHLAQVAQEVVRALKPEARAFSQWGGHRKA